MNSRNYLIIFVLILCFSSCKNEKNINQPSEAINNVSSDLQVDHLNIWVKNPKEVKEKLMEIGFSAVPDSASAIHHGQGTSGRYINFFNSYLELIFVYNQDELEENSKKNKDLDFMERANFEKNDASPFSVALKIEDYDVNKIPFKTIPYHQDWMNDNVSIYSAKNSKTHLKEPSIFVVYPELEWKMIPSLAALDSIPGDDDSWKELFKHPNGAQNLTSISITSTDLDLNTETMKAVNAIENITVKSGKAHLLELYFDKNIQGKTHDLRPELPLIIYL